MKISFIKAHSTQILVHILFWMLFVAVSLFVFSNFYWRENPFLQYFFILVVIVYTNNGLLLPYFVSKKWYVLYVFVFVVISFLATQLYCNVFAQCGCSIMKCLSDYLWQTLTPLIFFSFVWMLFRYIKQQDTLELITQQRTEMELKFLKSQINPHVLFNNLNTIYAYALEKPEQAPELIMMLSDNLKHVLYDSNTETVALQKELQFIDNYIAFQRLRTEGTKTIVYKVEVDDNTSQIAPLLLITLIENAFKHSALHSTIKIAITVANGVLNCFCENAFVPSAPKENTQHIGLDNLKQRLQLLYPNTHELTIDNRSTFKVNLKLEL